MKYSSVFRIADSLSTFAKDSMIKMGPIPSKSSMEIMVWRLSNTKVGEDFLKRYSAALDNPDLWRETVAATLYALVKIIKCVGLCAKSTDYRAIDKAVNNLERLKLKELLDEVCYKCEFCGMSGSDVHKLFDYIGECRNIFIHGGILPFRISRDSGNLGLNSFLKNQFEEDALRNASLSMNVGFLQGKGKNERFEALCKLLYVSFCFYFNSINPSLSNNPSLRHVGLLLSMGAHAVKTTLKYFFGTIAVAIWGTVSLIRFLFSLAITLTIALIILVIVFKVISFFNGSNDKYNFTDVEPSELTAWVDEMTPYQQMYFLEKRQQNLISCDLYHQIGDPVTSPSDSVTEQLYAQFKDYPDPKAHPLSWVPNAERLSRVPVLGWPYSWQWGGEKLFSSPRKNASSHPAAYMPIYQGEYYPVYYIRRFDLTDEAFMELGEKFANYPTLDILLLYSHKESRYNKDRDVLAYAKRIEKMFKKAGVSSKRIKLVPDDTYSDGVLVAVKNIPNQKPDDDGN